MIVGDRTPGPTIVTLAADTKRVARFAVPGFGRVAKLDVYLDGLGAGGVGLGSPVSVARAVIYDNAGNLVAVSDEVAVLGGQAPGWVDFPFVNATPGGVILTAANYSFGLIVGGVTNLIRIYTTPTILGGMMNADTYLDGPTSVFGTSSALVVDMAVFGIGVASFAPAPLADEFYYARLPFYEAQLKFSESSPVHSSALQAKVSWHGTGLDVERGSFAVVQLGGIFDDWIGERIKITSRAAKGEQSRSAICFVHNYADIDEPVSVPRRVFAALAPPGLDSIIATVEKMG
jgi:hypothetical protein